MKGNITNNHIGGSRRKTWKTVLVVVLILMLLAVVAVPIYIICSNGSDSYTPSLPDIDFDSADGYEPVAVKQGMILKGMSGIVLYGANAEQDVNIPNAPENEYAFILSIYLSDGTLIAKSDYVFPGDTLETLSLNQALSSGVYKNAIMVYVCYTIDEPHIAVSQCEFPIEIKSI